MKKIYLIMFLILFPSFASALTYPDLNSKIVEIYDLTDNKILYEHDSTKKSSIASLTKIVTTITAIETIPNIDEKVTITNEILNTVRWDASRAGLKNDDKLTYRDLLYASILPSGADATNSIAILSSGSINGFVDKMNEIIKKIGVENTHFINVTGLDDKNHYSTADDMRKILTYALNNPLFKEIYTTKEYTLSNGLKVETTLNLYNKYLQLDTSSIIGSKTGFTQDAGYCLSSLIKSSNHDIIIIVLNADQINNKYYNIIDTISLINFINKNYHIETLIKKDQILKELPVSLSNIDNYKIKANENISKFLPIDYDKEKIKIEYNGLEELNFTNKENDIIGTIKYYYDNELIKEEEIKLNTKLKINFIKVLQKYYYIALIIVTLIIILIIKKKKHV